MMQQTRVVSIFYNFREIKRTSFSAVYPGGNIVSVNRYYVFILKIEVKVIHNFQERFFRNIDFFGSILG